MVVGIVFRSCSGSSRFLKSHHAKACASLTWVPVDQASMCHARSSRASAMPGIESTNTKKPRTQARLADASLQRLTDEVQAFAQNCAPSEELLQKRETCVWELRTRLEAELPNCQVLLFGSAVTGLWSKESDLDVSIEVNSFHDREASIHLLRRIARIIRRLSGDLPQTRFGAIVPILRWASTRPGFVTCDISVNNTLAIMNSRLVAQYVASDTRVWQLAMVLKAWARRRGINDRSMGTLSSFALTLMLIHYLQKRCLLPCLQSLARVQQEPSVNVLGIDCSYCADATAICEEITRINASGASCKSNDAVGHLLLGFFRYFGFEYIGGTIRVNKLSSDTTSGELHGRSTCVQVPLFVVENPFEPGRDIATVENTQISLILTEFRRAHRLLSQGRSLQDALEPISC